MLNFLETEEDLYTSRLDFDGKLTVPALFDLFMDLAARHAEEMGIGYQPMQQRHAFWLAVRNRIRMIERPGYGQRVSLKTWPGSPGAVKFDRYYLLRDGEKVLAEGHTEWAVQDLETGRILKTNAVGYPVDLVPLPERVCQEPFTRFTEKGDQENLWGTYRVCSRDIDTGFHMNNVAYIRMIMSTFTVSQLQKMDIEEVEVHYASASHEGDLLKIYRRQVPEGWYFLVQKPDGSAAAQMAVRLRKV